MGGDLEFRDPESARLYLLNRPMSAEDRLALAEWGFSLRYRDPAATLAWCEVALVGAEGLQSDVLAKLFGYAGNARRIVGDFSRAEALLENALSLNPSDFQVLEFKASLLKDMLRLDDALEVLRKVSEFRKREPLAQASTLLQSAIVLDLSGRPSEAAYFVCASLDLFPETPPQERGFDLLLVAVQNLIHYLTNAGRPADALRLLRLIRPSVAARGTVAEIKFDWVMAKLAAALGAPAARSAFGEVRLRLERLGLAEEVALISLDLALFLANKGNLVEARTELDYLEPIFVQLGLSKDSREFELLAAVRESTEGAEALLLELVELVTSWKRFGHDPLLSFLSSSGTRP